LEWNKAKFAIIGLVILGVAWQYLGSPPSEIMTLIVIAVAGLGGFEMRGKVEEMKTLMHTGDLLPSHARAWWHKYYKYYWRPIGYFLAFGGFGLIADELIGGYLNFTTWGHEWIGVIFFLLGLGLISVKPRGK